MKAFLNHFKFELQTGIRNRTLLFMNYLFPLSFYALMGLLMTQINPLFIESMIPAMVTFAIIASTLLGLPEPLVTAREAGIFRSYKINNVPALSILLIPAISTIFHLLIVTIIITSTGALLFSAPLPVNWFNYILIFFSMSLASSGLGVLIGVISASSRFTIFWSQIIFLPSMILGGLMLPHNMLPMAMRKFAQLLPATHAMNAFRGLAQNLTVDFPPIWSILILLIGGIIAFSLAVYLFNWDNRNSVRRKYPHIALLALLPYIVGVFLLTR